MRPILRSIGQPRLFGRVGTVVVFATLVAGCGEGNTGPGVSSGNQAAGTYRATAYAITQSGQTEDLLAMGASIDLTLDPSGTTAGSLFVPGAGAGGGDFLADLAGTWVQAGISVTLDHPVDTFLRDIVLSLSGGTLSGALQVSGAVISVELTRL